jgi:peptidoglycan/LPS O-acetylase OafA/YrhL
MVKNYFFSKRKISVNQSHVLEMWRGGSSLTVAIAHLLEIYKCNYPEVIVTISAALAGAAVMAFFALSGFFIHKSLTRCYENNLFDWRSFIKSRANRILPPFVACLFFTVLLWMLAPYFFSSHTHYFTIPNDREGFFLTGFFQTAVFLNNFLGPALSSNGPLWSLAYEVWYYVLACLFALSFFRKYAVFIGLLLLFLLGVLDKYFLILGIIWIGGFLVSIAHGMEKLPIIPRFPFWIFPAGMLIAIGFLPHAFIGKASFAFQILFGFWMILHIIFILRKNDFIKIEILIWSGTFSYSLYVFHFPIMLFFYGVSTRLSFAMASFIVALLFSAFIGSRIEKMRFNCG